MSKATLTIASKNYGSWSLRGWLLCKMANLDFEEQHVGKSGIPLSVALRLGNVPVTRVENYCASGTEAFRGAVYAVAAGACDIALALG